MRVFLVLVVRAARRDFLIIVPGIKMNSDQELALVIQAGSAF